MIYGPKDVNLEKIGALVKEHGHEISFEEEGLPGIRGTIDGLYFSFTYDPEDFGLLLVEKPTDPKEEAPWKPLLEAFSELVLHSQPFCVYQDQFMCWEWKRFELQQERYKVLEGMKNIKKLHRYEE